MERAPTSQRAGSFLSAVRRTSITSSRRSVVYSASVCASKGRRSDKSGSSRAAATRIRQSPDFNPRVMASALLSNVMPRAARSEALIPLAPLAPLRLLTAEPGLETMLPPNVTPSSLDEDGLRLRSAASCARPPSPS